MKVLVTGATGFLGSHIAEQLRQQGHHVRCLVRPTSNTDFLRSLSHTEIIRGSLYDKEDLKQALTGIDAIIHNAGLTSALKIEDFYRANVDTTQSLLTAAKVHAPQLKRFVFVSSLAAMGPSQKNHPHSDPFANAVPVSHYGRSKWLAEQKVLAYKNDFPVTIIRPPAVYGPRDKSLLLLFKALQKGFALQPLNGRTHLSLIHVNDAAAALIKCMTPSSLTGRIYFIDDGHVYLFHDMMSQLAQSLAKTHYRRINIPLSVVKLLSAISKKYAQISQAPIQLTADKMKEIEQLYWTCNSHQTRMDLAWSPAYDWQSGSLMTYEWYKKAGWL